MPSLLRVQVSPRLGASTSRRLTTPFVERWRAARPDGHMVVRDLARARLPHVDLPWIGSALTPPERHSPEGAAAIAVSDELVGELQAADHVVIGTPTYNFPIPAALKAWIDHVVRIGVTVSPGNVGMPTGRKATVILATGGFSPGSPVEGHSQASSYLRQVLAWIGVADAGIILADRARAGLQGGTAVERFGEAVQAAA